MLSARKFLLTLLGIAIGALHAVPLYIALTVALKPAHDLSSRWLLPKAPTLEHFRFAWDAGGLPRAFANTLLITAVTALLVVAVSAIAAYPIARIRSRMSTMAMNAILAVMMIPSLSVIVPLYAVMNQLGGINTYWGIILVLTTNSLPLAIFLYVNFIKAVPKELDEAAIVDGCSALGAFLRVVLPQLRPVTATVLILKGLGAWNNYHFALYFLQKPELRTVTLSIAGFFSEYSSDLNAASAAALLVVLPVLAVFLLLQKQFVAGLTDGAVK
ncbi:carbohydrate ABC transporter permease [Paenibacillus rigui]|uniref:Maltose ABC transporter permease n=1 Tax=Paenibacillus rigui TaxID=554312 RepID=A0A229UWN0_9BACL|nr:carbohydrate ABC transporter permease [Paenibacillus rigui]OXM87828.1 maltose ABC transporter permease [Paenibacillus rigui]